MKPAYGISQFPETGSSYPLRVFLYKDQVTVGIDTSGDSLHKSRLPHVNQQSADHRDISGGVNYADSVEAGSYSGRSILRKRYISD